MQKSNNIFISHHQNEAQNHNTQTASDPFQHFGMTWTNQKLHLYRNYEGIKFSNCLLSFCPLSFCLPAWAAVLHGSEIWSLTLREHGLWCVKTGCSQDSMTLSGRKWEEARKNCIRRNYTICTLHKVFFLSDLLKNDQMDRTCSPCQAKMNV